MTWDEVEHYRDRTFRRRGSSRVKGPKSALEFIQEVGFCTAFSRHEHLPCLWVAVCGTRRPRMPRHTHSDYALGLTWDLKDRLPDARRVLYTRLLHGEPSLISLQYLPLFYRVFGPQRRGAGRGALGLAEQGILDWLSTHPPQTTYQLRRHGDFRGFLTKTQFERAISRLQKLLYVVKTRTVYEPKFTYIWGPLEKTFPAATRVSRQISLARAVKTILRRYFEVALCARRRDLFSIFRGLEANVLDRGLEDLVRERLLLTPREIRGAEGKWYVLSRDKITRHKAASVQTPGGQRA